MPNAIDLDQFEASYNNSTIDRLMAQITPADMELTNFKMMLSAKIYAAMQRKGWTQREFALQAKKPVSVIARWLSGTCNFTVDTLVTIQRLLEIRILDVDDNSSTIEK